MNVDTTRNDLMPSQIQPGTQVKGAKSSGAAQPPRNMIDASAESTIMLAYSPRKNRANPMPEYSTIWPATTSDSPSTTSTGSRLAPATAEITSTTTSPPPPTAPPREHMRPPPHTPPAPPPPT